MPLLAPALALLIPCQVPETQLAKQSRSFFEGLVEIKLAAKHLVFKPSGAALDVSSLMARARSAFPDASSIHVRSSSGSSSTSRGGGGSGSVSISLGGGGSAESLDVRLTSGSGETLTLSQQGAGQLTLELRAARTSIHLEQTKEKCKLRIKAGADSIAVTRKSFIEVFQAHPVEVKRRFIAFLESHIGKAPFLEAPVAPPGKVVARLRDGAELVGELAAAELRLQTAYGPLVIPRGELVQVFFPGSELGGEEARDVPAPDPVERLEVLVVARRFSPKGRLEAADFLLTTPYGELRLAAADVLHLGFGPEVPAEKPAEKDGKAGAP